MLVMKSGWYAGSRRVRNIIMTPPAMIRSLYADKKCMFIVRSVIRKTAARWFPQEALRQLRPLSVLLRSRMSCTELTAMRMIKMDLSQTAMPPEKIPVKKELEKLLRRNSLLKNLHLIRTSGNPALKIPLPMDRIQGNLMQGKLMKKEILLPENMVQEKLPRKKALRTVLIPVLRIRKA